MWNCSAPTENPFCWFSIIVVRQIWVNLISDIYLSLWNLLVSPSCMAEGWLDAAIGIFWTKSMRAEQLHRFPIPILVSHPREEASHGWAGGAGWQLVPTCYLPATCTVHMYTHSVHHPDQHHNKFESLHNLLDLFWAAAQNKGLTWSSDKYLRKSSSTLVNKPSTITKLNIY